MKHLIERYAAGGPALVKAIEGLGREELLARPVAGTWSIQEIVVHLMDSDLIGIDRMKRIAAEKRPLLIGYDENAFVQTLRYDLVPAEKAAAVFAMARELFAVQLAALPAEAFLRTGIHSEVGLVSLEKQVGKYIEHFEHHLGFIHKKRAMLGR
jgi:hypothetical protein